MRASDIQLTQRELTLIRVACIRRLDDIKRLMEGRNPLNKTDAAALAELQNSYDETRALLSGKLWEAIKGA